ncbi:MAG: hypothetical protein [Circular genetic element sp.]|nr:MAG: hypothetical protein [Circular genetic element sp.]
MARPMDFIRKPEPAVMEIQFNLPAGTAFLDINQVLSLVNRKFLRQGMQVPVQSMEVQFEPNPGQTSATGTVTIRKLPTTWILANSWLKGFKNWRRMIEEATDESPSLIQTFSDYKIFADDDHHVLGFGANIMPTSPLPFKGEWEHSTYEIPVSNADPTLPAGNSITRDIVATGPNYTGVSPATGNFAVSLIEGYAAGRALPNVVDPNMPLDAVDAAGSAAQNWAQALFNDGTSQDAEVISDIETQNNTAPYPFENGPIPGFPGTDYTDTMYPNGANQTPGLAFHDKLLITTTTIGGSDTAIGGVFPCGLVRFDTAIENGTATLILRLVPGEHRGYMQEPMQEMNRQ